MYSKLISREGSSWVYATYLPFCCCLPFFLFDTPLCMTKISYPALFHLTRFIEYLLVLPSLHLFSKRLQSLDYVRTLNKTKCCYLFFLELFNSFLQHSSWHSHPILLTNILALTLRLNHIQVHIWQKLQRECCHEL
jgi:hypothetical protein